ncbi:hypothetical protein SAMN06265346_11130 [Flavobacterium hercynium]|nr:hypothetical protein SAMN06265346_11130 [Flavobacterium hercynium]
MGNPFSIFKKTLKPDKMVNNVFIDTIHNKLINPKQ